MLRSLIHRMRQLCWSSSLAVTLCLGLLLTNLLATPGAVRPARANEQAPAQTPSAIPATQDEPAGIQNPFPSSSTMTDTVQRVLDQYLGRAPVLPQIQETGPEDSLTTFSTVYLPIITNHQEVVNPPGVPTATPTPKPPSPADVSVTLWPEPSINVARGARLSYQIQLRNYGKGLAGSVQVTLPYNNKHLRPVNSSLSRDNGDWVSSITDKEVVVTFGKLASEDSRKGTIVFEVAGNLANSTVLDMRASYGWSDKRGGGGPYLSNWAPVVVSNGPATGSWVWVQATPTSAPAGSTHTFMSNRFAPGEGVVTWLNTPQGVQALDLRGTTNSEGALSLQFSSTGLKPGVYQIVLYGMRTQLTGVATFTVR